MSFIHPISQNTIVLCANLKSEPVFCAGDTICRIAYNVASENGIKNSAEVQISVLEAVIMNQGVAEQVQVGSESGFLNTVTEPSNPSLDIYPNPATTGSLNITVPKHLLSGTIQITDVLGRDIESVIAEEHTVINTANYQTGMYFVQIYNQTERISQKVFVENKK